LFPLDTCMEGEWEKVVLNGFHVFYMSGLFLCVHENHGFSSQMIMKGDLSHRTVRMQEKCPFRTQMGLNTAEPIISLQSPFQNHQGTVGDSHTSQTVLAGAPRPLSGNNPCQRFRRRSIPSSRVGASSSLPAWQEKSQRSGASHISTLSISASRT